MSGGEHAAILGLSLGPNTLWHMEPLLIVAAIIAMLVAAALLWRFAKHAAPSEPQHEDDTEVAEAEMAPGYPSAGVLVSQEVLRVVDSSDMTVWEALEEAAVPIAVEYRPVAEVEIAKFHTLPVNTSAQQSMVEIVKALNPANPTLYRVVLPKGAQLVKAVGTSGFRGFARNGTGITAQAVLKPVAAGGAIAAGWPVFAVAGTVMVVDMVAQRELRAHQRKVEALLGRQEERHYVERIKDQRSADAQLTRAISLMLDGHNPNLDLALKSAYDEFHRSQQFLDKHQGLIKKLVDADGKVDYRRLEELLARNREDIDSVIRELHMARGAIAIRRKALLADAAGIALADPQNPYRALRKFLDSQVHQVEEADRAAASITEQLTTIELKGRWHDSVKSVTKRQEQIRALAASPTGEEDDVELLFLSTADGEIVQVISVDDDDEGEIKQIASTDEA